MVKVVNDINNVDHDINMPDDAYQNNDCKLTWMLDIIKSINGHAWIKEFSESDEEIEMCFHGFSNQKCKEKYTKNTERERRTNKCIESEFFFGRFPQVLTVLYTFLFYYISHEDSSC